MNIETYMLSDASRVASVSKRLSEKTQFCAETGCLEWKAKTRVNGGYGALCVGRRGQIRAHRAAWVLAHGLIPAGLYVCHSCDNPLCCNVAHLFLGTPADNMADKERKGRGTKPPRKYGAAHHKTTMTPEQVADVQGSSESLHCLAKKYGVSTKTIWRMKKRLTWRKPNAS
jgi:hypothetical protein